jgi:hypothetical protein
VIALTRAALPAPWRSLARDDKHQLRWRRDALLLRGADAEELMEPAARERMERPFGRCRRSCSARPAGLGGTQLECPGMRGYRDFRFHRGRVVSLTLA